MGQQALNRKPNLSVRRRLQLDANTEIAEIGITVRKQMELTNNKSLTDVERGMHLMAAKILVNGQPIVYDDLMDGFTTEEMDKITEFLFPDAKKEVERDISKTDKVRRWRKGANQTNPTCGYCFFSTLHRRRNRWRSRSDRGRLFCLLGPRSRDLRKRDHNTPPGGIIRHRKAITTHGSQHSEISVHFVCNG